jgi:hypothetical protein
MPEHRHVYSQSGYLVFEQRFKPEMRRIKSTMPQVSQCKLLFNLEMPIFMECDSLI